MSKPSVEQLPLPQLKLGEGPHWNPATQKLYLVDIPTATVYSYCPKTEAVHSSKLEGCDTIGFMTPLKGTSDAFVAGIGTALRLFRWDGSSSNTAKFERVLQELPDEPKTNRINDGKADPTGRLYFGTMKLENIFEGREGSFYSWSKDGGLTKHFSGVGVSNGMAWDQSKGAMYYIDSLNQSVDRFDYEPSSGKISNRRVAFDYAKNDLKTVYPDGMTIDSDGKLWVACYSGSRVINVDPATGQLVSEIPIPTQNVTSVAWGGPDLSDLYVTTFGGEEGNDKSGRTYRVRGLAAKGLPMYDAVV